MMVIDDFKSVKLIKNSRYSELIIFDFINVYWLSCNNHRIKEDYRSSLKWESSIIQNNKTIK